MRTATARINPLGFKYGERSVFSQRAAPTGYGALVTLGGIAYLPRMHQRLAGQFKRAARSTMIVATLALVVQTVLVWNSQVAAAFGAMPQPAVTINGALHYHDALAGNVHEHGGGDGHVHHAPDANHDGDHLDKAGCVSICSLFAASISFPTAGHVALPYSVAIHLDAPRSEWMQGVDPAALTRPPSISSIA
jgi:hypothetical protein